MFSMGLQFILFLLAVLKFSLFSTGQDSDTPPDPTQGNQDTSGNDDNKLYTQKDFDKVARNLRKEGADKALQELLREIGFEKVDDLKTVIAADKQRRDAELSEVQKATQQAEAEAKKREALENELKQLRAERQQERLERVVETALQQNSAKKPKDVLDLMKVRGKLADLLTEEGQVDDKKIAAAVEAFKKEAPDYFGSSSPGSPSNSGAKPPLPTDPNLSKAAKEMRDQFKNW